MKFITGSKLGALRTLYKTNPILALIKAGKEVLEKAKWTRDSEVKTGNYKVIEDQNVDHPLAGAFCAIGAVRRGQFELTGNADRSANFNRAITLLDSVAGDPNHYMNDIVEFNDSVAKSKIAVIKKFDEAIATGGKVAKKKAAKKAVTKKAKVVLAPQM